MPGYTYCGEPGLNFSANNTTYSEDDADFPPGRRGKTSRVGETRQIYVPFSAHHITIRVISMARFNSNLDYQPVFFFKSFIAYFISLLYRNVLGVAS